MKLVLLHALPLDERMWEPQSAFRALTPRLYGRGRTMEELAASLLEDIPGELALVGASMGGYAALAMARRAPERVLGILLAGSRADPDPDERRAARDDAIELVGRQGAAGLWDSMRPKLFPDDADPALVERARAIALEQQPDELVAAVEAIRDRADSSDLLAEALVVIGELDPFVSPDDVAGADVRVLPGCGHLPSMQRATEFNEILEGWLEPWR